MKQARRKLIQERKGLYLILTEPRVPHVELAVAAIDLGVPVIQLREKKLDDSKLLTLAGRLSSVLRESETLFIVNDRPDVAAEVGADGVHVGASDVGYGHARSVVGPDALVGLSTRTPEEAASASRTGADYLGVGPVFPTGTKPDALEPIGTPGLARACAAAGGLPCVAIGGITAEYARDCMEAGAAYVAVISAVCHAEDPLAALRKMMAAVSESGTAP